MDISMGYDGWVLAYAPVLVGSCLHTACIRGMIWLGVLYRGK